MRILSYRDVNLRGILRTAVAEIRHTVVELVFRNSQSCTAKAENAPEHIVHCHICPDVIESSVSHQSNRDCGSIRRGLADLRIFNVGLVNPSVANSDIKVYQKCYINPPK